MSAIQLHRRVNAAFRLAVASLVLVPVYTVARAAADEPVAAASAATAEEPSAATDQLPVAVTDVEGVERRLFRDGSVYIGGQPSAEALATLARRGVTAVVNLRTDAEMSNRETVPYDEAATAASLGMTYVDLPIGGDDHPYRPEVLDRLRDVLASQSGPVFLHCHSGNRAAYVWTAHLVRDGGLTLDQALAHGRAIAIPADPLSLLLGRPLELRLGEPAEGPAD